MVVYDFQFLTKYFVSEHLFLGRLPFSNIMQVLNTSVLLRLKQDLYARTCLIITLHGAISVMELIGRVNSFEQG